MALSPAPCLPHCSTSGCCMALSPAPSRPFAAECLPCLFSTTGPSSPLLRSSHRPRFRGWGVWGWGLSDHGFEFGQCTVAVRSFGPATVRTLQVKKPLEPLYNPARTNELTLWFHHHDGVIPSGGAAPLPASRLGRPSGLVTMRSIKSVLGTDRITELCDTKMSVHR